MKLRNWEVFEMGFVTKILIWKCVIFQTTVWNILLRGLDMILIMKKEMRTKLRQDTMIEKRRNFGNKSGTKGENE
jgi:hypothetical protein